MMEVKRPVTDAVLREAIEIRISECFGAMSIANAIGGREDDVWRLIRQVSLVEMIAEALDRGLPVREFKTAVGDIRFLDTPYYLKVRDLIGGRADFPQ